MWYGFRFHLIQSLGKSCSCTFFCGDPKHTTFLHRLCARTVARGGHAHPSLSMRTVKSAEWTTVPGRMGMRKRMMMMMMMMIVKFAAWAFIVCHILRMLPERAIISIYLSINLSIYLPTYLSIYLSFCIYIYTYIRTHTHITYIYIIIYSCIHHHVHLCSPIHWNNDATSTGWISVTAAQLRIPGWHRRHSRVCWHRAQWQRFPAMGLRWFKHWGFPSMGCTPLAGWFVMENPH